MGPPVSYYQQQFLRYKAISHYMYSGKMGIVVNKDTADST